MRKSFNDIIDGFNSTIQSLERNEEDVHEVIELSEAEKRLKNLKKLYDNGALEKKEYEEKRDYILKCID